MQKPYMRLLYHSLLFCVVVSRVCGILLLQSSFVKEQACYNGEP
jgi:hypothetical protein